MKRKLFTIIFLTGLLTACSMKQKEAGTNQVVVPTTTSISTSTTISPTQGQSVTDSNKLSEFDIKKMCNNLLSTNIGFCSDGSEVINVYSDEGKGDFYLHNVPKKLSNGVYSFFHQLKPSSDIVYNNDGSVDIPMYINDTNEARLNLHVKYQFENGNFSSNSGTITLLNKSDIKFSKMYSTLNYEQQKNYCASQKLNKKQNNDVGFLKACVYNGNKRLLDRLYKLTSKTHKETKYKIELACSNEYDSKVNLSKQNPFRAEIFLGDSTKSFPNKDILSVISKSIQENSSLENNGIKEVTENFTWKKAKAIPNFKKFYDDLTDMGRIRLYKYDLDKDGNQEVLMFLPGGTMGNAFWEVLHLNKKGLITSTSSGECMEDLMIYKYNGNYFFTSDLFDFNDKEFEGYDVYSVQKSGTTLCAEITKEKIGSETIFEDDTDSDEYFEFSYSLDEYIDTYKSYKYEALGNETTPNDEIQKMFEKIGEEELGYYGLLDVNNDGIDDYTNSFMFFPSNRLQYCCNYSFLDGKTKQFIDISNIIGSDLRCIIPSIFDGKNYIVCVLGGYGNYTIKLVEINGLKAKVIDNCFISVKNRILIRAFETHGERIGGV